MRRTFGVELLWRVERKSMSYETTFGDQKNC